MTTRKQTPALFELINKGPLRPDKKGRLATPKWFAKPKTPPASDAAASVTTTPSAPAPTPAAPAKPSTAPLPATRPTDTKPLTAGNMASPNIGPRLPLFSLKPTKISFSVSYWLVGLAALAFIFIIVLAYRFGQIDMQNRQADFGNAPPSPALQQVAGANPQADVLSDAPKPATTPAQPAAPSAATAAVAPPVRAAGYPKVQPALDAAPAAPPTGLCLILVTHKNPRDLSPVQAYFNTKGVSTEIGRMGKNYVLHSQELFANRAAAQNLKELVARLGADYNRYKSPTAPGFNPETFSQAYLANIERITR